MQDSELSPAAALKAEISTDDLVYFNALVSGQVEDRPKLRLAGTTAASLATFIRDVSQNAARRYEEGRQRLAA